MNNNKLSNPLVHSMLIAAALVAPISLNHAAELTGDVYVRGDFDRTAVIAKKSGMFTKVSSELLTLQEDFLTFQSQQSSATQERFEPAIKSMKIADGYVVVDAIAEGDASALQSDLLGLGASYIAVHGSYVSARVPISSISAIGKLDSLRYVHPVYFVTRIGDTTSQGDIAQRSDLARGAPYNVDGTGIKVGAMSDSYDCNGMAMTGRTAADDVASHDLPGDPMTEPAVDVLLDSCPGSDEGRALLQIIADVAPGAALAFRTASLGRADFANGIAALVAAGAHVIVDDVFYFREPMFQDGIIARAVDAAYAAGVAYFSAAGNAARDSYESMFMNSGYLGPGGGQTHDFDPGNGISNVQKITVPLGAGFIASFQWDQPFANLNVPPGPPGAVSDLDIIILGKDLTTILGGGFAPNVLIGDAVEEFVFNNPDVDLDNDGNLDTTFYIVIELFSGPPPKFIKYFYSGSGVTIDTFATNSGTSFGHSSAYGAQSVGAAFFYFTPPWGTSPPQLQPFSSAGNVPIFFGGLNGMRYDVPELRLKPDIVAPDGGNSTFFGQHSVTIPAIGEPDMWPNFFGTSASAPHAAGVAALMRHYNSMWTPYQIKSALQDSTDDMGPSGYDFDSGHGLIKTDRAIDLGSNNAPSWASPLSGQVVNASSTITVPFSAMDPDGDGLTLSQVGAPSFCMPLVDNGDGTGSLTCMPTPKDAGRYPIAVTTRDNGTPSRSHTAGFYLEVRRVRYSDVDNNWASDVWWRNSNTGANWLHSMQGPTVANSVGINTVSTNWKGVANGDADGDSDADMYWRNMVTGDNVLDLMNGPMVDSRNPIGRVGLAWIVVSNGDYNADGFADILWWNTVTGVLWIHFMNGPIIIGSQGVGTIGSNWRVVANGNYDGDKYSDILLYNVATRVLWMYLMNGYTITSSLPVTTVGANWIVVGSGDYNGDGCSDILLFNTVTRVIWMHLMLGSVIDVSAGINVIGLNSEVVANGDYNDDYKSDIFLRNLVTGRNWMYVMNATKVTRNVTVGTVNTNWYNVNIN